MALSDNPFIGLTTEELAAMRATWLQVLDDIAKGGQSYAFPGRSFTRADIPHVKETLSELRAAIEVTSGSGRGKQFVQAVIDTQRSFSG